MPPFWASLQGPSAWKVHKSVRVWPYDSFRPKRGLKSCTQYTSPETLAFHHSISLLAAMVVGGAGSIIGSLLGGVYYVLVPNFTNDVAPTLTSLIQGAILLFVLFVLPGGLASLPRALTRGRQRSRAEPGPAAPPTTPPSTAGSGTEAEEPETERQGHA